ncbi:MAG: ACT domain-containing protein [Eubacteriaceae bacterium]|jgi:hypothetical protein|nr:ACT domain-containing protein [Eubacteriaceae bacterium]
MINQVSVFIQNQEGKLGHVLRVLADADVNIRSLNIAETADYGILRLILQDTDKGMKALKDNGVMANITRVLAAEVPDRPGGLSSIVEALGEAKININYAYSFLPQNTSNAIIIFKVMDDDKARAIETLTHNSAIQLLDRNELLMK